MDSVITCITCQQEFLFSEGEQEFMREKFGDNFAPPKRCKACRRVKWQAPSEPVSLDTQSGIKPLNFDVSGDIPPFYKYLIIDKEMDTYMGFESKGSMEDWLLDAKPSPEGFARRIEDDDIAILDLSCRPIQKVKLEVSFVIKTDPQGE